MPDGLRARTLRCATPLRTCRSYESCAKACQQGLDKWAVSNEARTGFSLLAKDATRMVQACTRECTIDCQKPGALLATQDGGTPVLLPCCPPARSAAPRGVLRRVLACAGKAYDFSIPYRK